MYPTERLGAISDGVFAVALTLLVLELKIPDSADNSRPVFEVLAENWHEFVGWIVSFIVLARLWAIHHDTMYTVKRVSSHTVFINFVFLGAISLVPFGANIVGTFEFTVPQAIQAFSILVALNALALGWFIRSAEKDDAIRDGKRPQRVKFSTQALHHLVFVPIIAVIALVTSQFLPEIGLAIWVVEAAAIIIVLAMSRPEAEYLEEANLEA